MGQQILYQHTTNVHNKQAAGEMVPFFIELFHPKSVADVGCGLGSWLKVFEENGVEDICGFDGAYVDVSKLFIDPVHFMAVDLEKPLPISKRYDLVLSLEVAEHLSPLASDIFVRSLTGLSDIVVFSAAIPGQGGQNHINEQWPHWWAEKFKKQGYCFYDVFRGKFWDNHNIEWWYRQNMFLVTTPAVASVYGFQSSESTIIHPELYMNKINKINDYETGKISVLKSLGTLKQSITRAFLTRVKK